MTAEVPGLIVRYRRSKPDKWMMFVTTEDSVKFAVEHYLRGEIDDAELERRLDWAFEIEPTVDAPLFLPPIWPGLVLDTPGDLTDVTMRDSA